MRKPAGRLHARSVFPSRGKCRGDIDAAQTWPEVELAADLARMNPLSIEPPRTLIRGPVLRRALIAGARRVIARREAINKINVFPVPDGDTGSNLAFTLGGLLTGALSRRTAGAGELLRQIGSEPLPSQELDHVALSHDSIKFGRLCDSSFPALPLNLARPDAHSGSQLQTSIHQSHEAAARSPLRVPGR